MNSSVNDQKLQIILNFSEKSTRFFSFGRLGFAERLKIEAVLSGSIYLKKMDEKSIMIKIMRFFFKGEKWIRSNKTGRLKEVG